MRSVARIASWTAGLVPGLAVLALVVYAGLFAAGYRTVAVYSGSMEPVLHVGALAFVESIDSADVRVGDVITFQDPTTPGRLITHRVVKRFRHEGELVYGTKGDANAVADPWTIALPGTVGRLRFDVPVAGYALVYAKTREVRLALILLFSGLLLAWLLLRIWRDPEPAAAEPVAAAAPQPVAAAVAVEAPAPLPAAATPRELPARPILVLSGLFLLWLLARALRPPKPAGA